ncbi:aminoacyl-tRNA hydrolase [Oceaniovalibus sp. ACAM 378]|uniref:aminoacyl-tRNA hydrolase n=1 Tax=Oceaniovalibus sp. ACAM 378 TaxID=2599923 RepID=UPI0011D50EAA|nr:aminoacyl-tRNA hydrolase [Oceaniovalibus sp. ACAM 378]TYB87126.1 aminoacyl-tRNA hydrolase [Oceaniovalibus sp. ACAM 378]
MQLFAGLGNPGAKYAQNRHNIGFMALDRIADDHGFSPWRARFQGHMAEGVLGGEKVLLLKPDTFMNLSGQSVGEAMRFFKLSPAEITVFHDEIDLAPGKLRLKTGGGHAGHNGLRSLHQHIGAEYHRVRMGVGHPGHKDAVAGYVLHDFAKADQDWLDDMLRGICDGAAKLAAGDGPGFLNAVALRLSPARSSKSQQAAEKPKTPTAKAAAPAPTAAKPAAPEPTAPEPTPDTRNPLQKLADRFR